jgi:hypothetical protein
MNVKAIQGQQKQKLTTDQLITDYYFYVRA